MLADGHRRGMELVELEVGDLGSRTPCCGESVGGGDRRVRGVRVYAPRASGGENHSTGGQGDIPPVLEQSDAGDAAVTHDEVFEERVFDDVDARVRTYHGGHVEFEDASGGVSPGVHDAGA